MSHLLRRPAMVPALFSAGFEPFPAPRRTRTATRLWNDGSAMMILPAVVLTTELPLMRGAADLLRLVLPH